MEQSYIYGTEEKLYLWLVNFKEMTAVLKSTHHFGMLKVDLTDGLVSRVRCSKMHDNGNISYDFPVLCMALKFTNLPHGNTYLMHHHFFSHFKEMKGNVL